MPREEAAAEFGSKHIMIPVDPEAMCDICRKVFQVGGFYDPIQLNRVDLLDRYEVTSKRFVITPRDHHLSSMRLFISKVKATMEYILQQMRPSTANMLYFKVRGFDSFGRRALLICIWPIPEGD